MIVYDGRNAIGEQGCLIDNGYGVLRFADSIILDASEKVTEQIWVELSKAFTVVGVKDYYDNSRWDISYNPKTPSIIILKPPYRSRRALDVKRDILKFLEELSLGEDCSAKSLYYIDIIDHNRVCHDALKCFELIKDKETNFANKLGKFVSYKTVPSIKENCDCEHQFFFEVTDSQKSIIVTMDLLMLSSCINNGYF